MDRRRFIALAGLGLAVSPLSWSRELVRPEKLVGDPFTLGVASGDPRPDTISLWSRLAPDPLGSGGMPHRPAEVVWELSPRADFARSVRRGRVMAWPEYGHTVKHRVTGLASDSIYFYRFRFGPHMSRVGRFRTAPASDNSRPVRLGVVSCNRLEDGWFHAFRHLIDDDVDLIFHAGDYIYEKAAKPDRVRAHMGDECYSLADYRRRYSQYRLDPDLQDLHAHTAFVATWDDHEVSGNWAGQSDRFGTPDAVFAVRRAAAFQAYWEALPMAVPAPVPGGELALYRQILYGANLNLLILDTRQYRADQACGDKTQRLCDEALAEGRSMLGQDQKAWFKRHIQSESKRWNVVGQQVPPFRMDYDPGEDQLLSMDKWDGYPHAQVDFNRVLETSARPPITLSGDAHQHIAVQRRELESEREAGMDLVVTSVTSGGDGADKDSHWPQLQASNPDLLYNSRRRGYLLMDLSADDVTVEFRTLDRITSRSHQLFLSASARMDVTGQLKLKETNQLLRRV